MEQYQSSENTSPAMWSVMYKLLEMCNESAVVVGSLKVLPLVFSDALLTLILHIGSTEERKGPDYKGYILSKIIETKWESSTLAVISALKELPMTAQERKDFVIACFKYAIRRVSCGVLSIHRPFPSRFIPFLLRKQFQKGSALVHK